MKELLEKAGVGKAWEIASGGASGWEENTIRDIIEGSKKWGSPTGKQIEFLKKLVSRIEMRKPVTAAVPSGRVTVKGVVVSISWRENRFGGALKMLVLAENGCKYWSTVPREWNGGYCRMKIAADWSVEFVGTVEPSNDPGFGFVSRPVPIAANPPAVEEVAV